MRGHQLVWRLDNVTVGALVVFVSFILLNVVELHERAVEVAAIQKRKEDADLHRSQSNRMLEASMGDISNNSMQLN